MNIMTVAGNIFAVCIIMLCISLFGWYRYRNDDNDSVIKVFAGSSILFGFGTILMAILTGLNIISIQ